MNFFRRGTRFLPYREARGKGNPDREGTRGAEAPAQVSSANAMTPCT